MFQLDELLNKTSLRSFDKTRYLIIEDCTGSPLCYKNLLNIYLWNELITHHACDLILRDQSTKLYIIDVMERLSVAK